MGTDSDVHDCYPGLRLSEAHLTCGWQRSSGKRAVLLLLVGFCACWRHEHHATPCRACTCCHAAEVSVSTSGIPCSKSSPSQNQGDSWTAPPAGFVCFFLLMDFCQAVVLHFSETFGAEEAWSRGMQTSAGWKVAGREGSSGAPPNPLIAQRVPLSEDEQSRAVGVSCIWI